MTHMDPYNTNQTNQQTNDTPQMQYTQTTAPVYGSTPAPYRPHKRGLGTKGIVALIYA